MKILFVITRSDTLGGAQIHVRDFVCKLDGQGHNVTVLVGSTGLFTEQLHDLDIPFRSLRFLVRKIYPIH